MKGFVTRCPSSTVLPLLLLGSLKPNSRKKDTLIIKGLLGNLGKEEDVGLRIESDWRMKKQQVCY